MTSEKDEISQSKRLRQLMAELESAPGHPVQVRSSVAIADSMIAAFCVGRRLVLSVLGLGSGLVATMQKCVSRCSHRLNLSSWNLRDGSTTELVFFIVGAGVSAMLQGFTEVASFRSLKLNALIVRVVIW